MDDNTPRRPAAPAGWLEALAKSEAQLAAGEIVDGAEVMQELDECIAELEARQANKAHRAATRRR